MKFTPTHDRVEELSKKLNINWQDAYQFAGENNPLRDNIIYNMSNWGEGGFTVPEEKLYFEFYTNPIATKCICGHSEFEEGQDPKFTGTYKQCPDVRNITICQKCGIGRLAVIPQNYEEYYKSGFFASKKTGRLTDFDHEIEVAKQRFKRITNTIRKSNIKRVLDVGCAIGAFLHVLDNNDIDAIGIEVCNFEKLYRKSLSEKIFTLEYLESNYETKYFDIITIFDVLEHIYDISTFLKRITQFLKPNGLLIVEVPNMGKDKFEITEENRHHIKTADFEHIWYFTEKGMNSLLKSFNFKVEKLEDPISGKMAIYADISIEEVLKENDSKTSTIVETTAKKTVRVTPIEGNSIGVEKPIGHNEIKKKRKVTKAKFPSMQKIRTEQ